MRLLYIDRGLAAVGEFADNDRITLVYSTDKSVDLSHLSSIILTHSRIPHDFHVDLHISDGTNGDTITAVRKDDSLYFFLSLLNPHVNLKHVQTITFFIVNNTQRTVPMIPCLTLFESTTSQEKI